jgi:hypothetical protein
MYGTGHRVLELTKEEEEEEEEEEAEELGEPYNGHRYNFLSSPLILTVIT